MRCQVRGRRAGCPAKNQDEKVGRPATMKIVKLSDHYVDAHEIMCNWSASICGTKLSRTRVSRTLGT